VYEGPRKNFKGRTPCININRHTYTPPADIIAKMGKDYDVLRQDCDRSKLPRPLYKLVNGDKQKKYDHLKQDLGDDKKRLAQNVEMVVDCIVRFPRFSFQPHANSNSQGPVHREGRPG
jgi:hypothetical protein